jgi:triosephosphate isomerase
MNKIVVGNMKMNMNDLDITNYLDVINAEVSTDSVIICPTSIYIPYFLHNDYAVGIQNLYKENKGAFTGEVSPRQAASMGVRYAIIGHSERREIFDEDDFLINEKLKAALNNNITPILCVGETKKEHEYYLTELKLKKELRNDLKGIDVTKIIIAYEPIWAIGTGVVPTNEDIDKTVKFIKKEVTELSSHKVRVLYGGSVNDENIKELNKIDAIDGYLVGGASCDANKFLSIIKEVIG